MKDLRPTIGIIVPYNAQKNYHVRVLEAVQEHGFDTSRISVETFDGSQGSEFDITLLVIPLQVETVGFMKELARINVGATRGRDGLGVIGTKSVIQNAKDSKHLRVFSSCFPLECTVKYQYTGERRFPGSQYFTPQCLNPRHN